MSASSSRRKGTEPPPQQQLGAETAAHRDDDQHETTATPRGFMVIKDGQVESCSGALVGQDHLAQIFQRLLQSGCGEDVLTTGERFRTVTIAFPQHYYTISRREGRIYVARLAHASPSAEMFVNSARNTARENERAADAKTEGDSGAEAEMRGETSAASTGIEVREGEVATQDAAPLSTSSSSSSIGTVRSGEPQKEEECIGVSADQPPGGASSELSTAKSSNDASNPPPPSISPNQP